MRYIVLDGYDWNACYSWAWEVRRYFISLEESVHDVFPDINWAEDETGLMHQCMAIHAGLAEMPAKRFFKKATLEDRG